MKRWIYWLGILLSVIFLYIAISGLDLNNVWLSIKTIDLIWLLPGLLSYFIGVGLRSIRWSFLLKGKYSSTAWQLFPSICIGYLGNNIFPARAGEFLRAYHLREKRAIPFTTSLASIIVERIFDGLVMIVFILLGLPTFMGKIDNHTAIILIQWILLAGSVLFLLAFLIVVFSAVAPDKSQKMLDFIFLKILPAKWHEKYRAILARFFEGLGSLQSLPQIGIVLGFSLSIWLFETGLYWCMQRAFGLRLPFSDLLLLNGALNILSTIPSAPGYVGIFDAPGISIMSAMGTSANIAGAYILSLHAVLWLPITLVGLFFFIREGLQWSKLKSQQY
ncbi:MAG: flippase-like domain-containing protein [Chloroflexi bacterium]|nr:flippase-like domain-containing protein [Chloroflexota bacterium]